VQTVRIPQGTVLERRWTEVRERTIAREIDPDGRVLSEEVESDGFSENASDHRRYVPDSLGLLYIY
jgi:hypothetical protein